MNQAWTENPPQYVGIELDQDGCSEPVSMPIPNEDFEPFLSEYPVYDHRLQTSLGRIEELSIPANDPYSSYGPNSVANFSIPRGNIRQNYDYFDTEPEEFWPSSPRKNAPVPEPWSSPTKRSPSRAGSVHPSVIIRPNIQPPTPMLPGPTPGFFMTPSFPSDRQTFSPSHAPPMMDLPSSPPESPSLRPTYRPAPPSVGRDSLGISNTGETPPSEAKSGSDEPLQWEPVLTIPVEVHRETDKIIRSQQSMSELKTKRKSCLPPGAVDEYISCSADGSYRCLFPFCERIFRRKYNLKSHIQTHLCDRPYICDHCDSAFVRPHDLKRHELCHQTTRQFVCPCGKGFTRQDAMQRHRARMICSGGASPKKSPRKRGGRVASPESSSESDSPGTTPVL